MIHQNHQILKSVYIQQREITIYKHTYIWNKIRKPVHIQKSIWVKMFKNTTLDNAHTMHYLKSSLSDLAVESITSMP